MQVIDWFIICLLYVYSSLYGLVGCKLLLSSREFQLSDIGPKRWSECDKVVPKMDAVLDFSNN